MGAVLTRHTVAACSAVVLSSSALAGPEWVEGSDAGSVPGTSQQTQGSGPVARIRGTLGGPTSSPLAGGQDRQDMYLIQITDPAGFEASTFTGNGGSAEFDSRLWLFRVDGRGLLGNDDTEVEYEGEGGVAGGFSDDAATIAPPATDATGQTIPTPGLYLIAISLDFDFPESPGGSIFTFDNNVEVSGPDGPGGQGGIVQWSENSDLGVTGGDGGTAGVALNYIISLSGAALVPVGTDCNWVDNAITLTANEATYWSVATGQPKGVSPFTVLSPAGDIDPEGSTDRVLRGYLVGWAVNPAGEEIRFDHLHANATVIDYRNGAAWEYNGWHFQVVQTATAHGQQTGTPGVLNLDGVEYSRSFSDLLLNFQAVGASAFSGSKLVTSDTDLTLHPVSTDLRQETDGPVTTKATFSVWNMNEVKFSGADRCITCWDERRLGFYDLPNHFLRAYLQTDHGKARINGVQSQLCDLSQPASLLGVAAKYLSFDTLPLGLAGSNLIGMGVENAVIRYDVGSAPPPTATLPSGGASLSGSDARPRIPMNARASEDGGIAGPAVVQDRVSASEKGSLFIISKLELRWDAAGNLIQDTFVELCNDYPEDVRIQMYFIHAAD